MNHRQSTKQRYSSSASSSSDSPHENMKSTKTERTNKPLAIVNGQKIRLTKPKLSPNHQYFHDETQYYTSQSNKRKYDSSLVYQPQTKRFHSEQTLPIYPTNLPHSSSESYYYDHSVTSVPTTSRCMLLKNDPTFANTSPMNHLSANSNETFQTIEQENIYSDDIEHLLDIFKNEVELIGLDPIATTSTSDCSLDINHCLSTNEFCPY